MATCQSELVHETIMLLSFVPLLAIGRYGAAAVFIITSAAAALFDSLFVVVQRFNRFRLLCAFSLPRPLILLACPLN